MFKVLPVRPHNPRHFIALCFIQTKDDPSLKTDNRLLKKVWERNNLAIFKCHYGYFVVNKNQQVSELFYESILKLKEEFKSQFSKKTLL